LKNAKGARSALTDLHCAADHTGQWSVTGMLANDTKQRSVFALDFDVINAKNGSVQGRTQQKYTLAPGKHTELRTGPFYRGTDKGLTCVANVQRAPA
jgi:hypothetical protein